MVWIEGGGGFVGVHLLQPLAAQGLFWFQLPSGIPAGCSLGLLCHVGSGGVVLAPLSLPPAHHQGGGGVGVEAWLQGERWRRGVWRRGWKTRGGGRRDGVYMGVEKGGGLEEMVEEGRVEEGA